MNRTQTIAAWLATLTLPFYCSSFAQTADQVKAAVAEFEQAAAPVALAGQTRALDVGLSVNDRVQGLRAAAQADPMVGMATAKSLLEQQAPAPLAREAVAVLSTITFPVHTGSGDHAHHGHGPLPEAVLALRSGLTHPSLDVRGISAVELAQAQDSAGIAVLSSSLMTGTPAGVSPTVAARALTQAGPEGQQKLTLALKGAPLVNRIQIARTISSNEQGRVQLRSILLSPTEQQQLRVVAAESLSTNDPMFGTYAGFLLNVNTPTPLRVATLAGIKRQLETKTADPSLPWQEIQAQIVESGTKPGTAKSVKDATQTIQKLDLKKLGFEPKL